MLSDNIEEAVHLDVVNKLIAAKIDVNIKDDQEDTALHIASMWGSLPIIEALVAAGADVHAKNNVGKTALDYALKFQKYSRRNVIDYLTKVGIK